MLPAGRIIGGMAVDSANAGTNRRHWRLLLQNNGMAFGAAAAAALDDGVAELRGAAGPGSPLQWIRSAADEGLRAANEVCNRSSWRSSGS